MAEMLMTEIMKIKPSSTISPHWHNGIDDDNDNYDDEPKNMLNALLGGCEWEGGGNP